MEFMRAHGNAPGPTQRPGTAGALTGALAEIPTVPVLWYSGALESLAQAFTLSRWPALALHLAVMALAGGFYGWLFCRAANDRRGGWLFGISYGFLLWMLGPVTLLQWIKGRPAAVGGAALGLFGAHLLYGLALGLLFPWIHGLIQPRLGNLVRSGEQRSAARH
jgi:hypothetical protein